MYKLKTCVLKINREAMAFIYLTKLKNYLYEIDVGLPKQEEIQR